MTRELGERVVGAGRDISQHRESWAPNETLAHVKDWVNNATFLAKYRSYVRRLLQYMGPTSRSRARNGAARRLLF
jgi:hypothetical protein